MEHDRRKTDFQSDETTIALLGKDVGYIRTKVDNIETCITANYITRLEFDPIKRLVYGTVAIIMSAVIISLVTLVVKGAMK